MSWLPFLHEAVSFCRRHWSCRLFWIKRLIQVRFSLFFLTSGCLEQGVRRPKSWLGQRFQGICRLNGTHIEKIRVWAIKRRQNGTYLEIFARCIFNHGASCPEQGTWGKWCAVPAHPSKADCGRLLEPECFWWMSAGLRMPLHQKFPICTANCDSEKGDTEPSSVSFWKIR